MSSRLTFAQVFLSHPLPPCCVPCPWPLTPLDSLSYLCISPFAALFLFFPFLAYLPQGAHLIQRSKAHFCLLWSPVPNSPVLTGWTCLSSCPSHECPCDASSPLLPATLCRGACRELPSASLMPGCDHRLRGRTSAFPLLLRRSCRVSQVTQQSPGPVRCV